MNKGILERVEKVVEIGNIKDRRKIEDIIKYEFEKKKRETRRKEEEDKLSLKIGIVEFFEDKIGDRKTPIEKYMANAMASSKIIADEQFKIGTKIVDFAYVEQRLVIECDGYKWHRHDKEQIEGDMERDIYLGKRGWRVLHFSGSYIRRDVEGCINEIKEALFIE